MLGTSTTNFFINELLQQRTKTPIVIAGVQRKSVNFKSLGKIRWMQGNQCRAPMQSSKSCHQSSNCNGTCNLCSNCGADWGSAWKKGTQQFQVPRLYVLRNGIPSTYSTCHDTIVSPSRGTLLEFLHRHCLHIVDFDIKIEVKCS